MMVVLWWRCVGCCRWTKHRLPNWKNFALELFHRARSGSVVLCTEMSKRASASSPGYCGWCADTFQPELAACSRAAQLVDESLGTLHGGWVQKKNGIMVPMFCGHVYVGLSIQKWNNMCHSLDVCHMVRCCRMMVVLWWQCVGCRRWTRHRLPNWKNFALELFHRARSGSVVLCTKCEKRSFEPCLLRVVCRHIPTGIGCL